MSIPTRQQLENFRANHEHDEMLAAMAGLEPPNVNKEGPVWALIRAWDEMLKADGQ